MAFMNLEDFKGIVDVTIFPRTYEKSREMLEVGKMLVIKGKVQYRNEKVNLLVQEMWEPSEWESQKVRSCVVQFNTETVTQKDLKMLTEHLKVNRGECQLYFEIIVDGTYRTVVKPSNLSVDPGRPLTTFVEEHPAFTTLLRY